MALALSIDYGATHGDGIIAATELQSGLTKWECRIPGAHPFELAISPDNESAAIATTAGLFISKPPMFEGLSAPIYEKEVRNVLYSPNGLYIAAASKDQIVLFNKLTNEKIQQVNSNDDKQALTSLSISPSSTILASGSIANAVLLWSLPKLELLETLTEQSVNQVTSVMFISDVYLVAAGNDPVVRVWDLGHQSVKFNYENFVGKKCLSLAPSKSRFAIGDQNGISIIETKLFQLINDGKHYNFPLLYVTKMSFVTDISMLAVSSPGPSLPSELNFIYTNEGGSFRKLNVKAVSLQGVSAFTPSG